jgi:hypothetical protein
LAGPDIFLSYNRVDADVARHFAEGFKALGLDVWWDQALASGEAYDQVTEQALRGANMPPPSASLIALAPGLAFRIATSVRAIGFASLSGVRTPQYTLKRGGIELAILHIRPNHTPSGW